MAEVFAKLILIDGVQIDGVDGIKMDFDLDTIMAQMTMNIPQQYSNESYIRKQVKIEVYYGYVSEFVAPNPLNLVRRFSGFITNVNESIAKGNRSLSITALDKLEFLTRSELLYKLKGDTTLQVTLELMMAQITEQYPEYDLNITVGADSNNIIPEISGSSNGIEILTQIKDDILIYIFYHPVYDTLGVISPFFAQFLFRGANVEVYDFNIDNIIGTLNYGDISNNVNKVTYIGLGGIRGIATDYSAIGLGQTTQGLEYKDMTTGNKEALEEKARNKLLDLQRNNVINFSVPLMESTLRMIPGEMCRIADGNKFSGDEIFIIRKASFNIAKGDMKIDIEATAHTLTEFPEDLVLTKFGLADEDTIQVQLKENMKGFN